MKISITEFNDNISHYIELASKEDIILTKRNVVVAIIISKSKWQDMEAVIDFVNNKYES